MISIELVLLVASGLILISIGIAKLSDSLGVPVLLLFLGVGMLAGSDGPGGIEFTDANLARSVGTIALLFILFAGGLDTKWSLVKPVLKPALSLATVGVVLTAAAVGIFAWKFLGLTLLEGLLLGSIISSTDAAAVFSVLRSKNVSLRGSLGPLLEFESGSNDPMAVFLTVSMIQLMTTPDQNPFSLILLFLYQMGFGAAAGFGSGKAIVFLLNRMKFSYQGFYPVFVIAFATFVFGATSLLNGSGFLAVYMCGVMLGNAEVVQKKSLLRFFDGLAWLGQIGMFLTLGLLVFPSHLTGVAPMGLVVSAFLIIVARPASVFISLFFSKLGWQEKMLISWVGIRGAVPIILATFPFLAHIPNAPLMFNLVLFIVLTSALLQGWSVPVVARLLKVAGIQAPTSAFPLEFEAPKGSDTDLVDFIVPYNAAVIGRPIVELGMPGDSLIVLIIRNEQFIVPSGGTVLEPGDSILALVNKENLSRVRAVLSEAAVEG